MSRPVTSPGLCRSRSWSGIYATCSAPVAPRTSAMRKRNPLSKDALSVSGMLSEVYRTLSDQDAVAPPRSWTEAAERFQSDRRIGSLGLVRPQIASALVERCVEQYLEPRAEVRGPEALRPAFFLRRRSLLLAGSCSSISTSIKCSRSTRSPPSARRSEWVTKLEPMTGSISISSSAKSGARRASTGKRTLAT